MTFIERLKAHVGGLIRLKSQLYWHNESAWDGIEGRVCLLLNAVERLSYLKDPTFWASSASTPMKSARSTAYVLLLIDNKPRWIFLSEKDVELIK